MVETQYEHRYNVGDAVLVHFGGGEDIPGVIEDERDGKYQVKLAMARANPGGQASDDYWASPDELDPSLQEETGGTQALPG